MFYLRELPEFSPIALDVIKAWFTLNVSVIETNQSFLLVRTLLRFVGFHKQPSFVLLRGLLYLEACKSCSTSGIQLEITTFRKSSLYLLFLALLIFLEDIKSFLCLVLLVSIGRSHSIQRHRPRKPSQALASPRKSSTCATQLQARRLLLRRL